MLELIEWLSLLNLILCNCFRMLLWFSMVLVVCVRISSRLNLVVFNLIGLLCYVMVWFGGEIVSLLNISVLGVIVGVFVVVGCV